MLVIEFTSRHGQPKARGYCYIDNCQYDDCYKYSSYWGYHQVVSAGPAVGTCVDLVDHPYTKLSLLVLLLAYVSGHIIIRPMTRVSLDRRSIRLLLLEVFHIIRLGLLVYGSGLGLDIGLSVAFARC